MTDTFTTHRPTGRASYPVVLLAGVQGGGKSWTAAAATGLAPFRRSFWLELGEQMADEYGDVPGANYEIIEHDGSYRQILAAVKWAARESKGSGPGVFVLDSVTELWTMLSDEAQIVATERAKRKNKRVDMDGEGDIAPDLWNRAKERSNDVMEALREFNGLVVLTARLDEQTVFVDGQPSKERTWKARTHKDVPFYAQVIMQARAPRQWTMTKVASTKLQMPVTGYLDWPEFTLEELLIRMELDGEREPDARRFQRADPAAIADEQPGTQRPTSDAPTADEPRGDLGEFMSREDLDAAIVGMEKALDKAGLLALHAKAKAHNNRIAMAKVESAGKRVTRRLDAGETPPGDDGEGMPGVTAEDLAESEREAEAAAQRAEEAALDAARDAEERGTADAAHEVQGEADASDPKAEPSSADAEPESTSTTTTPESSPSSTDDSATPSAGTEGTTEGPNEPAEGESGDPDPDAQEKAVRDDIAGIDGAQVAYDHESKRWVAVVPDSPQSRANTPRRRGLLTALTEKHGQELPDVVFSEFGLDAEYVSTSRLSQLV